MKKFFEKGDLEHIVWSLSGSYLVYPIYRTHASVITILTSLYKFEYEL